MSGSVYLFLRHAPFKTIFLVLIVFGYFFIYEYHIISRNYAISVFLLTLVFSLLNKTNKNHLLIAACLFLLALTHIYSIVIVIALCCVLIILNRSSNTKYIYATLILFSVFLLYSLKVPADHFLFKFDNDPFLSYKRIGKAFSLYLKGFLPIPDFTVAKVWNTNFIVNLSKGFGTILSVLFAIVPFFIFKKNKLVLFFFYFSSLSICVFIYFSPILVASRYCGYIFLILLFSFWLQKILDPFKLEIPNIYSNIALTILLLHVFAGVFLYVTDLKQPFSNSKNVATYLRENKLENKNIYLSNISSGPAISAYLNKKIIYLESGEKSSFCKWNIWPFVLTRTELRQKLQNIIKNDTSVLILNNSYMKENLGDSTIDVLTDFNVLTLKTFNYGMVTSEKYHVYCLVKKP